MRTVCSLHGRRTRRCPRPDVDHSRFASTTTDTSRWKRDRLSTADSHRHRSRSPKRSSRWSFAPECDSVRRWRSCSPVPKARSSCSQSTAGRSASRSPASVGSPCASRSLRPMRSRSDARRSSGGRGVVPTRWMPGRLATTSVTEKVCVVTAGGRSGTRRPRERNGRHAFASWRHRGTDTANDLAAVRRQRAWRTPGR